MTDDVTPRTGPRSGDRPRGPWDPDPNAPPAPKVTERRLGPLHIRVERGARSATAQTPAQAPGGTGAAQGGVLDKGQSPAWALISTLLLGGFLWWMTGSLIIVACALFGLLVHEYGHVLAMNRVGMGPARIYIIPFLGGLAKGQRPPVSEWHGVLVSLAGPAFGLLAILPVVGIWQATGQEEWVIGAFFIGLINLVNMAPASPLDGSHALGPVLARVHPMLEKVALLVIGAAVVAWGFATGRWILAAFLCLSLFAQLRAGPMREGETPLSNGQAVASLGLYVLTLALCAAATVAALLPLADGSVAGAASAGLRVLGFDRLFGGVG